MERAGLPPLAVINAATGTSSNRLAFKDKFGQIKSGFQSRFILTRHSPLESISNLLEAKICRVRRRCFLKATKNLIQAVCENNKTTAGSNLFDPAILVLRTINLSSSQQRARQMTCVKGRLPARSETAENALVFSCGEDSIPSTANAPCN